MVPAWFALTSLMLRRRGRPRGRLDHSGLGGHRVRRRRYDPGIGRRGRHGGLRAGAAYGQPVNLG